MKLTRLKWEYTPDRKDAWTSEFTGDARSCGLVAPRVTIFGHTRYSWYVLDHYYASEPSIRHRGESDTPLAAMLAAEDALLGPLPLRRLWTNEGRNLWSTAGGLGTVSVNVTYDPETIKINASACPSRTNPSVFFPGNAQTLHEAQLWVEERLLGPLETP